MPSNLMSPCVRTILLTLGWVLASVMFQEARAQDDLDSLDAWVRSMHPDPFVRCGESAWNEALDDTRERWIGSSYNERVRLVNVLLQTLQDSHTAVSTYDWIWGVEWEHGTLPIRWAIEGKALWTLDSGLPELPEEVRVLAVNGIPAEVLVEAALDLSTMEGPSHSATSRTAAHNVTSWALAQSNRDTLEVTWVDLDSGLPTTASLPTAPWRKANRVWAGISTRRQVVEWTFPDGSHLTRRDNRRALREDERLQEADRPRRITTHWPGATTLKITSFSSGSWARYHRRLREGFAQLQEWGSPLILDLRANPGGQSPRMEALWKHLAASPRHLPYALVAKQSDITARANGKHYRRWKKRWVDKNLDRSSDAKYIYTMATLPLGETDTLWFPQQRLRRDRFKGPLAVLMDGESASASVSFAGAVQTTRRGVLIGESCLGPANGTMGNPYLRVLPLSGIVVSISTAVYMAEPCKDWSSTRPVQADLLVPHMWRRNSTLNRSVSDWVRQQTSTVESP